MEQGLAARAREFYRYYPHRTSASSENAQPSSSLSPHPLSHTPPPSEDKALTAFAQLGALRLNTRRCIISFFDRRDCYLLAEATRTLFINTGEAELDADRLCWGPTIFPKEQSICHYTVNLAARYAGLPSLHLDHVPSLIVNDLSQDDRFKDFSFVAGPPYSRFYAGVPIQSPSGHNIGTYCVLDENPRDGLSPPELNFLKEMAITVMRHLEMTRATEDYRRGKIMVKSLGSFAEGKNGLEKWWQDPWESDAPAPPSPNLPDNANTLFEFPPKISTADQQAAALFQAGGTDSAAPSVTGPNGPHSSSAQPASTAATSSADLIPDIDPSHTTPKVTAVANDEHNDRVAPEIRATFSRAADMIVRATEADGAVFFDAKISTFGGLVDDDMLPDVQEPDTPCVVLGAALGKHRCGTALPDTQYSLSESVLRHLLKHYTHGHILNFDNEDTASAMSSPSGYLEAEMRDHYPFTTSRKSESTRSTSDEDLLRSFFPKARSLVLYPLWDTLRDRWYASAIIWSSDPMRVFTSEQELSYLAAFSNSIMAEVARMDTKLADTAKADFISSISHELRSPLHGILGMTDLLKDTEIDIQQTSHVATIETCGKTLLETINHVLDYAKINNLTRGASRPHKRRTLSSKNMISPGKPHTNDIMTLIDDVDMSVLTQDVVESVFAGYTYAKTSAQTYEIHKSQSDQCPMTLILDINYSTNYVFRTQPGAWRRVIMNLFGNSLKYTDEGHIKVKLEVKRRASTMDECCDFRLIVSDSGIGMSQDYISNRIFHSFAQENPLSQGTGLGLSIVKQIVESLGGNVEVRSEKGRGSKFTISCPLKDSSISPAFGPEGSEKDRDIQLRETRERTKGLKVCLVGFREEENCSTEGLKNKSAIRLLLKALERLCNEWFGMELCDSGDAAADLVIASETFAQNLRAHHSQNPGELFKTPVVVVCHGSASVHPTTAVTVPGIIYEYINQPIGPHKMAIALSSCLERRANRLIAQTIETGPKVPDVVPLSLKENTLPTNAKTHHLFESSRPHFSSATSAPELRVASPGLAKSPKYPKPIRPLNCLCVDDNPINLRLLRTFIEKLGHRHVLASNGLEALNYHKATNSAEAFGDRSNRIDVILMDINMPVMDGLESARQIRAHELRNGLPKVTIIALTGVGDSEVQQEANSSGINLFLIKPMRLAELEVILKGVVTGQDRVDSELQEDSNETRHSGKEAGQKKDSMTMEVTELPKA